MKRRKKLAIFALLKKFKNRNIVYINTTYDCDENKFFNKMLCVEWVMEIFFKRVFIETRCADDIAIINISQFSLKFNGRFACHMLPFSISQNNKCRTSFDNLEIINNEKLCKILHKTFMFKVLLHRLRICNNTTIQ